MFQQQTDQGIGRIVVLDFEAEIPKRSRVNEVVGVTPKQIEKSPQLLFAGRGLQILDDVELDVAVAENLQRTVRLASVGIVVDGDLLHGRSPFVIRAAFGVTSLHELDHAKAGGLVKAALEGLAPGGVFGLFVVVFLQGLEFCLDCCKLLSLIGIQLIHFVHAILL